MRRVLIVDDEEPIRRLLRAWVDFDGAAPLEARTAEEALATAASQSLTVALCDLRLPGMSGFWLAERLREVSPETAVVITTGVHEFDAVVRSLQVGAIDYLLKPFSHERFSSALQRAHAASEARQAVARAQRELENRRAQIADALADLEMNTVSSLEAMLAIMQARDPTAYEHAHRVAQLAVNLALALQVCEPDLSDIERAALLHDVGRLSIPDELLARARERAPMSGAERTRLRAYPLHGHTMLRNVPFLVAANEIAVSVNECFDGSGFPHGLRGTQIPLGARIIAVANAFDELVVGASAPPLPPPRAFEILSASRAAEFDPAVVAALGMLQACASGA